MIRIAIIAEMATVAMKTLIKRFIGPTLQNP
jgi:hypothetical protein